MTTPATSEALLHAAAANLAAWHDSSLRALGLRPRTTDQWWTCATPAPNIFYTAVSLRREREPGELHAELLVHLDDPAGTHLAVCDSFGALDLRPLGLAPRATLPWYARDPGPLPDDPPTGLEVTLVQDPADLAVWEDAAVRAFGVRQPVAPSDIHHPAILDDPAMHVLAGRADGEIVAVAMAYRFASVVGVYGVGTLPPHRGRGYARAITRAAVATGSDRAAILQPTTEAAPLYRTLGFRAIGEHTHWA